MVYAVVLTRPVSLHYAHARSSCMPPRHRLAERGLAVSLFRVYDNLTSDISKEAAIDSEIFPRCLADIAAPAKLFSCVAGDDGGDDSGDTGVSKLCRLSLTALQVAS